MLLLLLLLVEALSDWLEEDDDVAGAEASKAFSVSKNAESDVFVAWAHWVSAAMRGANQMSISSVELEKKWAAWRSGPAWVTALTWVGKEGMC